MAPAGREAWLLFPTTNGIPLGAPPSTRARESGSCLPPGLAHTRVARAVGGGTGEGGPPGALCAAGVPFPGWSGPAKRGARCPWAGGTSLLQGAHHLVRCATWACRQVLSEKRHHPEFNHIAGRPLGCQGRAETPSWGAPGASPGALVRPSTCELRAGLGLPPCGRARLGARADKCQASRWTEEPAGHLPRSPFLC